VVLPVDAEAQVRLGIAQMYSLPADLRIETGRRALGLSGVSPQLRARHLAVMVLSLVAASRPAEAREAAAEAQQAVELTNDALARLSLEFALLALDEASFDYGSMVPRIDRIHRLGAETGERAQVQAAEWFRANVLAALGRMDDGLAVVSTGLAIAKRDHQAWIAPRWDIWRGWLLLQLGRLSDARAALEGAFASQGYELALAIPDAAGLLALGQIAVHTGDQPLTRRCADLASASLAAGNCDDARRHLVWLLALQGMAHGDARAARLRLRPDAKESSSALLPVLARQVGAEVQLVRLALAAGDEELADRAVHEATERAVRNTDVAALVATAAHAQGLRRSDGPRLREAVGLFRGQSRPLLLASALEDLGHPDVAHDRPKDAISALEEALTLYQAAGATWDARRTRGALRALGVRRRSSSAERPLKGWGALTDSEREVGRLVAGGLTNAEAGQRLFVSPHTVGTHLRHVFAKLDVNSRVQLARIAIEHEQDLDR
jgi:DNA-binding CsgD family transcriptional regulator